MDKDEIHGYFYWVLDSRGSLTPQRQPIDSKTPLPRYVMRVPLSEREMGVSLLILEKRYPYEVWPVHHVEEERR